MTRTALRVASGQPEYQADISAMNAALHHLRTAAADQVREIASSLGARERATLAVCCYGRAHLHRIGLALAAQCSIAHLEAAAGSLVAGSTIYAQSRELPPTVRTPDRRSITLATSACRFVPCLVSESPSGKFGFMTRHLQQVA